MFENPWTEGQSLLPHQIVLQPSNSPSGLPLWIVLVLLLEVLSLDVNSGEQGPVPTFKINSGCPGVFPPYFVHNYIKKIPLEQCFHTKLQPQLFCSHLVVEAHWISPAAGGRVSWGCWMPKAAEPQLDHPCSWRGGGSVWGMRGVGGICSSCFALGGSWSPGVVGHWVSILLNEYLHPLLCLGMCNSCSFRENQILCCSCPLHSKGRLFLL